MSINDSTERVRGEWSTTHGHTRGGKHSRVYVAWMNMLRRCRGHDDKCFRDYTSRGIKVCDRWLVFENFLADMGEPPPGMTLDRRDNDKGYEPGNCRWATRKQQQRNMRRNRLVTFQGETKCLTAWAEEFRVAFNVLDHRLRRGWSVERAMTHPVGRYVRKVQQNENN